MHLTKQKKYSSTSFGG